nr:hypothetical protein CFP56_73432 [Quercus suber]
MKAFALIDPVTKKWDSNMLNGLFTTQEVELISSIPLCPNAMEDNIVWPLTLSETWVKHLGDIIRDSRGQELASLSEQASLPFSPEIIEAMAATRAISFAQGLNFTSFIVERDSANTIKTLKSDEASLSPFGHILNLAKSLVVAGSSIRYSHVGQTGNIVSHNLAQHVRHVRSFSV